MSVLDKQVIHQCLSHLPFHDFFAPVLDYRMRLTTVNLLKIMVTGQLLNWDSLGTIERALRSDETFQAEFQITSIHKSQLSRRINQVPVSVTQALFAAVVHAIRKRPNQQPKGNSSKLPLAIVDSTSLRMPPVLGDWAYVTRKQNSVKVHTRLLVIDEHTAYPDCIVPSTGNISDYEGSDDLVVDQGVLYVMDRGYVCYKRMAKWAANGIDFVVRLGNHHVAEALEEREIPAGSAIVRDAVVILGNQKKTRMQTPLRLIEFHDDQGRLYRLVTTRQELLATELMDIYRNRWLIELFFKWLKQHLKFAKLYSHQPHAVWNHIFLALVAYGLSYLVKLDLETKQTGWDILRLIRLYAIKPWSRLAAEVHRKPSKYSKGGPKKGPPKLLQVQEAEGVKVRPPKKRNR